MEHFLNSQGLRHVLEAWMRSQLSGPETLALLTGAAIPSLPATAELSFNETTSLLMGGV